MMRIAHVFNQCNDGWSICKGLRAIGVDAHLWLRFPSSVLALPHWEESDIDIEQLGNMENPDWDVLNQSWTPPEFVHIWSIRKGSFPFSRTIGFIHFLKKLGEYDLVVGHSPFAQYARYYKLMHRKQYAVLDAGDIRYVDIEEESPLAGYRKCRWGYEHADKIFFTNIDTVDMFRQKGLSEQKVVYTPFAIDTNLYKKTDVEPISQEHHPVLFSPCRQSWTYKGNDRVITAFHKYLTRNSKALLVMIDWGADSAKSKQLVSTLGIGRNVRWLKVMSKKLLIRCYNASDVVLDQFVYPASGTLALEAMACEKPVVGHADLSLWQRVHGSAPPIVNAASSDEIFEAITQLEAEETREEYGTKGRKWVAETCAASLVARIQLQVYREISE